MELYITAITSVTLQSFFRSRKNKYSFQDINDSGASFVISEELFFMIFISLKSRYPN